MAGTYTPEAELRRARFHHDDGINATMTLAAFARLRLSSTAELIEHLKDAAPPRTRRWRRPSGWSSVVARRSSGIV
jgi:hypothetical protein